MSEKGFLPKTKTILAVALTFVSAIVLIMLFQQAWAAVFPPIFLLWKRGKKWIAVSFLLGFIEPLLFYLLYPLPAISKLASIIGSIIGMNGLVVLVLYPLIYGILMTLGFIFWSGFYDVLRKRSRLSTEQPKTS